MVEHDYAGRATWQAAKYRKRAHAAEQFATEFRQQLIRVALAGRLADPTDFDTYIGAENVLDECGRIDYNELELRVRDLLRRKPYLAGEGTAAS